MQHCGATFESDLVWDRVVDLDGSVLQGMITAGVTVENMRSLKGCERHDTQIYHRLCDSLHNSAYFDIPLLLVLTVMPRMRTSCNRFGSPCHEKFPSADRHETTEAHYDAADAYALPQ